MRNKDEFFIVRFSFLLSGSSDDKVIDAIKKYGMDYFGITETSLEYWKETISFKIYTFLLNELNKRYE